MENIDTLPTRLTLSVDGKPVAVKIPARMTRYSQAAHTQVVDIPQLTITDFSLNDREWCFLEALAWASDNIWYPNVVDIIFDHSCRSPGVGISAGLPWRVGCIVQVSLLKKGLIRQSYVPSLVGFTLLGWATWLHVRNLRIAAGDHVRTR